MYIKVCIFTTLIYVAEQIIDYDQLSSATMNIVMKNSDNKMLFANSVICRYKNLFGCKRPENFFIKFFKKG